MKWKNKNKYNSKVKKRKWIQKIGAILQIFFESHILRFSFGKWTWKRFCFSLIFHTLFSFFTFCCFSFFLLFLILISSYLMFCIQLIQTFPLKIQNPFDRFCVFHFILFPFDSNSTKGYQVVKWQIPMFWLFFYKQNFITNWIFRTSKSNFVTSTVGDCCPTWRSVFQFSWSVTHQLSSYFSSLILLFFSFHN
jgi:hypothetical protein